MVGIILLYHLAHELERKMSGTRKTSMVRRELINLTDMGRTIRNRNLVMGGVKMAWRVIKKERLFSKRSIRTALIFGSWGSAP